MKKKKILAVFMAAAVCISSLVPTFQAKAANTPQSLLDRMTTEQKVAQLLMPAFRYKRGSREEGMTTLDPSVRDLLKQYGFAGVILYSENMTDTAQTVRLVYNIQKANAQGKHGAQLFMAIDQEGGRVARLSHGTRFPGNMALGATGDASNATLVGQIIGSEMAEIGFNMNFAPVVDVNNNPANPVIGTRSFSDDPNVVSRFGISFMNGLQSGVSMKPGGVIASLKHFPGHGDVSVDTHTGLARVEKSYDELKANELIPYENCIKAGCDVIMTAHIQYPKLEGQTYVSKKDGKEIELPATLSKNILTNILRGDLNFDGVVVTDSLEMAAIADHFSKEDAATLAINAGSDILLMPVDSAVDKAVPELKSLIKSLASRVKSGAISESRLNESVLRILQLKKKKGLFNVYGNFNVNKRADESESYVGSKNFHATEWQITKKSITLVKNEKDTLPIKKAKKKVVILTAKADQNMAVEYAVSRLRREGKITPEANVVVETYEGKKIKQLKGTIKDAKKVLILTNMTLNSDLLPKKADGKKSDSGKVDAFIKLAHKNKGGRVAIISCGLPYDADRYPGADAVMLAWNGNGMTESPSTKEAGMASYGPSVPVATYLCFAKDGDANDVTPATGDSDGRIFTRNLELTGTLPVNIPKLNSDYSYGDILYSRGYGLSYSGNLGNVQEQYSTSIPKVGSITLSATMLPYTGGERKPVVTVVDREGKTLVEGQDFTVQYPENNRAVGKHKLSVNLQGQYAGTQTMEYTVHPKKTVLVKVSRDYEGFSAKWQKRKLQVNGYQIQYSMKKDFSDGGKIKTVNSVNRTSTDVENLKSGKKYYVRVRTYKNGAKGAKIASPWSESKMVTTE